MSIIGEILGINTTRTWVDEAVCAQTDPDSFFPEKGGSVRDAVHTCQTCPVINECLHFALSHDERFGVWGGHTERQRRRLKRRLEHGAIIELEWERRVNCRNGHLLAAVGVDTRGRCRQCHRDSVNRCQQRRRAHPPDDMPHGRTRYNLGCHCDVCTTANTDYIRDYNHTRRKHGGAA